MKDKRLLIVMVMLMTTFIGFGIIIPVLPELIKEASPGSVEFHTGMMLSIYSAVSFLLSPFWGGLSDKVGRRPVILIGVLGFAASFLLFGIADGSLSIMYASRVLGGLFSGAVTSVIVAYVADITPPEQRTRGMGLVGMSIGLGFTIGPGVGGLLSLVSQNTPFFAAAALALITFLLAVTKLTESLPPEQRRASNEKQPSRFSAFTGSVKYLYVLALFVSLSLSGLEATLQLFGMKRFDVTPLQVGIMFLVCGLVGALIQGGVVRRLIRKGEEPKFIAIGLVISAIGFLLIVTAHSLLTATIYLAIFGIGNALIRPCVTSLITQKTTVRQGVASGLSSSMDSLGRIIGPLTGALLFSINLQLPYVAGGVLSLAALLLLFRFRSADKKMGKQTTSA
ncbi:tetracycline resistance MFS efflux pump [Paenibacillus baekrokdamisoli]|uniref:Tetracycline resistance MFS efflux pump n=1 Tax=Paenibacillus baekrokdamisoli TaxID=1712516 RepID=A0A3G9IQK2_9BACL|nr:MFS transporter [Paenibacillus baekrokdamisoli]MBB3070147.1 MFS family permease [Paenibacillus baekrokdamisoli]BBH21157.1 tetracycline resistance MFS efflux pump [Paenibacillus baekrokdamisoli]